MNNDIERITVKRMIGAVIVGLAYGIYKGTADGWSAAVLWLLILAVLAFASINKNADKISVPKWIFEHWVSLAITIVILFFGIPEIARSTTSRGRASVVLLLLGLPTIVNISLLITEWKNPSDRKYFGAVAVILLGTMAWMSFVVLRMTAPDQKVKKKQLSMCRSAHGSMCWTKLPGMHSAA